jgi:hypothetical protein
MIGDYLLDYSIPTGARVVIELVVNLFAGVITASAI